MKPLVKRPGLGAVYKKLLELGFPETAPNEPAGFWQHPSNGVVEDLKMMSYTRRDCVRYVAFLSRVFVTALQFVSNHLSPDHDADAFRAPLPGAMDKHLLNSRLDSAFQGLTRWDAQYFLHIANYGYTYENCLAFFPLFPAVVHVFAKLLFAFAADPLSFQDLVIVSSIYVNVVCFSEAAVTLYDLGRKVLANEHLAFISAILFCINPASVFFSAPYSETLFALATFKGLYHFSIGNLNWCAFYFMVAGAARSNGVINLGFLTYKMLRSLLRRRRISQICSTAIPAFVKLLIRGVMILLPFLLFQLYSFDKFCVDTVVHPDFIVNHARENGYKMQGEVDWCNYSSIFPMPYFYIQHHYWGVGFLKYYQWKQVPNFILAIPIACLVTSFCVKFVRAHPACCVTLGLFDSTPSGKDVPEHNFRTLDVNTNHGPTQNVPAREAFVYAAHAFALLVFCLLCINVQVTTRMLASSSPVVYWAAAYTYGPRNEDPDSRWLISASDSRWLTFLKNPNGLPAKFVQYYFIMYLCLGTALFSNFLPWT